MEMKQWLFFSLLIHHRQFIIDIFFHIYNIQFHYQVFHIWASILMFISLQTLSCWTKIIYIKSDKNVKQKTVVNRGIKWQRDASCLYYTHQEEHVEIWSIVYGAKLWGFIFIPLLVLWVFVLFSSDLVESWKVSWIPYFPLKLVRPSVCDHFTAATPRDSYTRLCCAPVLRNTTACGHKNINTFTVQSN